MNVFTEVIVYKKPCRFRLSEFLYVNWKQEDVVGINIFKRN